MTMSCRGWVAAIALLATASMMGVPASAQQGGGGVKAGFLTCDVSSGFGFVLGSSRTVRCRYSGAPGVTDHYTGSITKVGVDIGYLNSAVMVWTVFAPTTTVAPGALAGNYAGVTGSATVGAGVGANVLLGGSGNHFMLQPLSIEGNTGLNVAGGVAAMQLTATK